MPVFKHVLQDPTDTVLQGEQLRAQGLDARPADVGPNIFLPIMGADATAPGSLALDEDLFPPMNTFVEIGRLGMRRGKDDGFMVRANGGVICGQSGAWVPVLKNECGPLAPRFGAWSVFTLSGVTRDSAGAALGLCTVKVFITGSDAKEFETTSSAAGAWSINVGASKGPYYVVAYKSGAPVLAGTSINTLVPVEG